MSEPIDLGLILEGEDAEAFMQYIKHPTCTPTGIQVIKDAKILAHSIEL